MNLDRKSNNVYFKYIRKTGFGKVISIKYEYSVAISTEATTLRYKINTTATSL